jgi:hypothetical protein
MFTLRAAAANYLTDSAVAEHFVFNLQWPAATRGRHDRCDCSELINSHRASHERVRDEFETSISPITFVDT